MTTTEDLQRAVDAAVLAYRELQTPEAKQALMDAMQAHHNDFLRREREEAMSEGVEIYQAERARLANGGLTPREK